MVFNTSDKLADVAPDGLPLINTLTFWSPLIATLPLISTDTNGTFCSTSLALPPAAVRSFSALYTILSIWFSTKAAWPVTVTSFNAFALGDTKTDPKFLSGFESVVVMLSIVLVG